MSDNIDPGKTALNHQAEASSTDEPVVEELLVEEVSIDGMCGVY